MHFYRCTYVNETVQFSDYVDKLLEEVLSRREVLPSVKKSVEEIQPILAKTPQPLQFVQIIMRNPNRKK